MVVSFKMSMLAEKSCSLLIFRFYLDGQGIPDCCFLNVA